MRGISFAKLFAYHRDYVAYVSVTTQFDRTFNLPSCKSIFVKGTYINFRVRGARISENNEVKKLFAAENYELIL